MQAVWTRRFCQVPIARMIKYYRYSSFLQRKKQHKDEQDCFPKSYGQNCTTSPFKHTTSVLKEILLVKVNFYVVHSQARDMLNKYGEDNCRLLSYLQLESQNTLVHFAHTITDSIPRLDDEMNNILSLGVSCVRGTTQLCINLRICHNQYDHHFLQKG